jgi:histidinol-phosphatase
VSPDLELALRLADAADAIALGRFRARDLVVETKPDLTPVTEADKAAEEAIRDLVAQRRPGEGVLGEEQGDDGSDIRWIVDPIDGTRNYVRGLPVWATLIAFERERRLDAAVVSAPALGRRWWAARGEGAFAGDQSNRIHVSAVDRLADSVVSTTEMHEMPAGWVDLARQAWVSRAFGDFWQHCLVAEGSVDVAAEPSLQIWDYSAVQLIVEEAGGRCTTFDGDVPTGEGSFISTNGTLHETALALLGGTDPSRSPARA